MQQEQHVVRLGKRLPSPADRARRISFALETSFHCRLKAATQTYRDPEKDLLTLSDMRPGA